MPGREHHAVEIPSMVDLDACLSGATASGHASTLGIADNMLLVGWVGRLDAKKRVEDFIEAAALVHRPLCHAVHLWWSAARMRSCRTMPNGLRRLADRARACPR